MVLLIRLCHCLGRKQGRGVGGGEGGGLNGNGWRCQSCEMCPTSLHIYFTSCNEVGGAFEDVLLVEFTYLVLACMPGGVGHHRRFRTLLLSSLSAERYYFPLFVDVVGTLISSCPSVHMSSICRDEKSSKVHNPLFKITRDANDSVRHSNLTQT